MFLREAGPKFQIFPVVHLGHSIAIQMSLSSDANDFIPEFELPSASTLCDCELRLEPTDLGTSSFSAASPFPLPLFRQWLVGQQSRQREFLVEFGPGCSIFLRIGALASLNQRPKRATRSHHEESTNDSPLQSSVLMRHIAS